MQGNSRNPRTWVQLGQVENCETKASHDGSDTFPLQIHAVESISRLRRARFNTTGINASWYLGYLIGMRVENTCPALIQVRIVSCDEGLVSTSLRSGFRSGETSRVAVLRWPTNLLEPNFICSFVIVCLNNYVQCCCTKRTMLCCLP
jgi:hypothetical protein